MPVHEIEPERMEAVAGRLAGASRIVILTGAGVSAESGIRTFREPEEGLWAKYDPMELAHIDAFHRDPELVTRWYHDRFNACRDCEPNAAHHALAALQRARAGTVLITQNIDGLHQRAGSADVIEIHGNITRWRCVATGAVRSASEVDFSAFPPRTEAGDLLRPDVVWFGEMLPEDAMARVAEALAECDAFLTVGTSAVVYPAAGFLEVARSRGAFSVEVNLDPTPATEAVDVSLQGPAGAILRDLVELVVGR